MASKPTIYKSTITLSDLDRNYYQTLNLTIAQHPSETIERMMARVLAFCINAQEYLLFSKGLSAPAEPDIWARTLTDQISLWIDVGEPAVDRIRKATRISSTVKVYSFNSKANVWWTQWKEKFSNLDAEIFQFAWRDIQKLAALAQRTMDLSITITENCAYVSGELGECEIPWESLQMT